MPVSRNRKKGKSRQQRLAAYRRRVMRESAEMLRLLSMNPELQDVIVTEAVFKARKMR